MLNPNELIRRDCITKQLRTYVVYAEDKLGVLSRITSLFRRRGYNINSLTAGHTDISGVSRLTTIVEADDTEGRLIEANLYKLVNVLRVQDVTHNSPMKRELALIKVKADADNRVQVMKMIDVFRARAIDVTPQSLVAEISGTEDKIDGLLEILKPFGIIESVRTGCVAMTRGPETVTVQPHFVQAVVSEPKA